MRHFGYDSDVVIAQLDKDCPVFVGAISGIAKGHAWVIDGYITKTIKKKILRNGILLSETDVESTDYVHCNWGWKDGANNGWFANKLLEEKNLDVSNAESLDSISTQNYYFNFWFRMIEYNKPSAQ